MKSRRASLTQRLLMHGYLQDALSRGHESLPSTSQQKKHASVNRHRARNRFRHNGGKTSRTQPAGETQLACIAEDVVLGENVRLSNFINLYGCRIGDNTRVGPFVEVQKNAQIGRNCKIQSHTFICEGVTIEDDVFIGHSVTFINDTYPRATNDAGGLQSEKDWQMESTVVQRGASIGSNATILSRLTVGAHAIVGAGSVVTKDVPPHAIVAGNPAVTLRDIDHDS